MRTVETRVGLLVLGSLVILGYMGVHLGAFRLNSSEYHTYQLKLNSSTGLSSKSDVKIAGVKVGWIEDIGLDHDLEHANVIMLIEKRFKLHNNAHGLVRQDGLLAPRYIEIIPGDTDQELLQSGATISNATELAAMDNMLQEFKEMTQDISAITDSVKKLTHDTNMHINQMAQQIEQLLPQAGESVSSVQSIAQKVDDGTGLIGKLVNEDHISGDLEGVVTCARSYVDRLERMKIVFDAHFESMFSRGAHYCFKDLKGYLQILFFPREDFFYLFQVVSSQRGFLKRTEQHLTYFDPCTGCIVDPATLDLSDEARLRFVLSREKERFRRNSVKFGFQFGKIFFGHIAFRFGLIEGTGGVALDVAVPFNSRWFSLLTTFEAFDFRGSNRIDDRRPHLKWLNRLFFLGNAYLAFGVDDFISCNNASFFLGAGIALF